MKSRLLVFTNLDDKNITQKTAKQP